MNNKHNYDFYIVRYDRFAPYDQKGAGWQPSLQPVDRS